VAHLTTYTRLILSRSLCDSYASVLFTTLGFCVIHCLRLLRPSFTSYTRYTTDCVHDPPNLKLRSERKKEEGNRNSLRPDCFCKPVDEGRAGSRSTCGGNECSVFRDGNSRVDEPLPVPGYSWAYAIIQTHTRTSTGKTMQRWQRLHMQRTFCVGFLLTRLKLRRRLQTFFLVVSYCQVPLFC
jgi:hypothetical protein